MHPNDLAEYLDHDPFREPPELEPEHSPPVKPTAPPRPSPVAPETPQRSAETEREKFKSDILRMVMDIFTGARWTTRQEYTRASALRDRKGRKTRE